MNRVKANLFKVYLYKFISDFWLVVPILIPFYQSNGLSATQVFIVQAVFSASALIFEVPSGYLSDVIGRRKTMILSACFMPLGLLIYSFGHSFIWFAAAEFVLGLANSLRSGTDSALIYDSLLEVSAEGEYKKAEGRALFYNRTGTAIASILGGLLAVVSLRLPIYLNFLMTLPLLPIALTMVEPHRKSAKENPFKGIIKVTKLCLTNVQLRPLTLFFAILTANGVTCFWAYYLYYRAAGINVGYFGLILAAFILTSAISSRQAHRTEDWLGQKRSLAILLLIGPIMLTLGLVISPWLIPLIIVHGFLWGLSEPLLADLINRRVNSEYRATAISVSAMIGRFGFVILAPLFGYFTDLYSLSTAFLVLGSFFVIVSLYCFFSLKKELR